MKKNKSMIKELSLTIPPGLLTCLLTLSLQTMPIGVFPDYFSFSHYLATFCCLYMKRLSSLKSALNFPSSNPIFLPSKCTSLLLGSKPVQRNFLNFFKIFKNSARSKA